MHAGQLFSEHFLVDGIRTTDAYRRLTEDQLFLPRSAEPAPGRAFGRP
jgi:hypothetical protein